VLEGNANAESVELLAKIIKSETTELQSSLGDNQATSISLLQSSDTVATLAGATALGGINGIGGEYRRLVSTAHGQFLQSSGIEDVQSSCCWNEDPLPAPLLFDRDALKKAQDQDKQEVLSQISELDASEMSPIISSCQLALCILYARKLLIKMISLSFLNSESKLVVAPNPNEHITPNKYLDTLINSLAFSPTDYVAAIKASFYQNYLNNKQKNDIFPISNNSRALSLTVLNNSNKESILLPHFPPFLLTKNLEFDRFLEGNIYFN